MNLEKTIQTKENGNIVFSYLPIKLKETFFQRVIIVELCYILISVLAFRFVPQNIEKIFLIVFIIILVILSIMLLFKWTVYTDRLNGEAEENIINEALKYIVKKDVSSFGEGVIELERELNIKTGNYGELKEKSLIIVLSNGIQIKYNINFISYFHRFLVQEIDIHYLIKK